MVRLYGRTGEGVAWFCGRAVFCWIMIRPRSATERLLAQPPGGLSLDSLLLPTAKDADELFRRLGRDGFNRYMRLLTEEVGKGEKRLLAFCLKYPEVASHVERMLEEDDLPFTSETYRNLLHFTAQGVAVSDLSSPNPCWRKSFPFFRSYRFQPEYRHPC